MMDEDLLVTNAFYPIAVLTEKDNKTETNVEYNYNRDTRAPYATENMGPFPNIKVVDEKRYDVKTANDFRQYLKKKGKQVDNFNTSTNAEYMDTMMERGNMPVFFDRIEKDRVLKIKKYNMHFDTRLRDDITELYNYTIELPFTLYNVKYVKLTASEIPFPIDAEHYALDYNADTNPVPFPYMYIGSTVLNNTIQPQNDFNRDSSTDYKSRSSVLVNFGIFARIQLDATPGPKTIIYNGFIDPTVTIFDDPIPSLTSIDIQLLNPDGSYFGSNSNTVMNSSFSIEFTTYVDSATNTNISSRRGVQDKSNYETNLLLN